MNLEFSSSQFPSAGTGAGDSYILLDFGAALEGSEFGCLLCGNTTKLIGFDARSLEAEVYELRNLISEITSLDQEVILPSEELSTSFCCPSCLTKVELLKETYESTAKLQYQLKCLSTAVAYQLLAKQLNRQTTTTSGADGDIEWKAQFHEWNENRLENQVIEHDLDTDTLLDVGQQILSDTHRDDAEQMIETADSNVEINTESAGNDNRREEFYPANIDSGDHRYFAPAVGSVGDDHNPDYNPAYTSPQHSQPDSLDFDLELFASRIETISETNNGHGHTETSETRGGPVGTDENNIEDDMELQHSRLEFPCQECSRLFVTEEGLKEHMKRKHEAGRKYPCSKCKKVYVQQKSLIYHMKTIHGKQEREKGHNTRCPICDKALSNKWYLLNHMYKHRKEFPNNQFPCKTCRKEFGSIELLLAHVPIHRGKFRCTHSGCLKSFPNSFDLEQHLGLHARTSSVSSCDFCYKSFASQGELEVHMVVKHETLFNRNENTCDICKESFPTKTLLRAHRKNHVTQDYKCGFCENSYRTRWELETHEQSEHSNEKPHRCEECDATFRLKSHLREHLKRHPNFPFQCEHCTNESGAPRRFARIQEYWSHLTKNHPDVHAQEVASRCDKCPNEFSSKEECDRHKLECSNHGPLGRTRSRSRGGLTGLTAEVALNAPVTNVQSA